MTSASNSYRNVVRYQGQDYRFVPTYLRNRDPYAPQTASTDIKPKENQGYYPVTSLWTNTTNGNIWALKGIFNNLANWVLISGGGGGGGNFLGLTLDPAYSTGISPVFPNPNYINYTSDGTLNFIGTIGQINFTALPVLNSLQFHVPAGTTVSPNGGIVNLTSTDGTVTIAKTAANTIDFSSVGGSIAMSGIFTGTDAQTVNPNGTTKLVTFQSPNASVSVTKDSMNANAVDLNAVPTLGLLNFNINGVTNVAPSTNSTNGTINLTGSGGLTITNPAANTINFSSSGGGSATSYVTNAGTANPSAGVLNVLGIGALQSFTSATTSNTVQIKSPNCALYIVDANASYGTHTTIQAAVTAAAADIAANGGKRTVFIRPGTYTENVVLSNSIDLAAYTCDAYAGNVTLNGVLTASNNSTCAISGINFTANGSNCINLTGTNKKFNVINCNFSSATGTTFVLNGSNTLILTQCTGNLLSTSYAFFTVSAGSTITFLYCNFANNVNSVVYNTSAGNVNFAFTLFQSPVQTSGNSTFGATNSTFPCGGGLNVTPYVGGNSSSSTNRIAYCVFDGGTQPGVTVNAGNITQFIASSIDSISTYAISGAGELQYTEIWFSNSSSSVSPSTIMTSASTGPVIQLAGGGAQILSRSGSPQGVVTAPKGSLCLRNDGSSTTTRMYVNTNGGTNWTAVITQS